MQVRTDYFHMLKYTKTTFKYKHCQEHPIPITEHMIPIIVTDATAQKGPRLWMVPSWLCCAVLCSPGCRCFPQELSADQQSQWAGCQPQDKGPRLHGLDGLWPAERGGVRVLFIRSTGRPATTPITQHHLYRKQRDPSHLLSRKSLSENSIYDIFNVNLFV